MEITQLITEFIKVATIVIGTATIIFRALVPLASLTKSEKDDNFLRKGLNILTSISKFFALNKEEEVTIKIK